MVNDLSDLEETRVQQAAKLGGSEMSGLDYVEYAKGHPPGNTCGVMPATFEALIAAGVPSPIDLSYKVLEQIVGPIADLASTNDPQAEPNAVAAITEFDLSLPSPTGGYS